MAKFIITIIISSTISHARSWNFESLFEAYTNDVQLGHQLCLGECSHGQCVYDWHGDVTTCERSFVPTKRFTTKDNEVCQSNCGEYYKQYEWCVTDSNHWDYCSRSIALKSELRHTTKNMYLTCTNDCDMYSYDYYWCSTVLSWEECNIDDKELVPNYPTDSKKTCEAPCKFYSNNEAYCYDTSGDWVRCYLNPRYEHMLYNITQYVRRNCRFGVYNTNGYKLCKKLHKRTDYSDFNFHECDLDVEEVAERHRMNNPSDEVRTIDRTFPVTQIRDPILSYTTYPRRSSFAGTSTDDVDIPLVLHAQLTTHTLLPVGASREHFRSYVTNNYNRMNPISRHSNENYDERGHILGSRLGGPMEMFNIFPQTWRLNRGSGSSWFEMEQHVDNFLRGRNDRYVEFLAILGYLTDASDILIPRPDHIGLRLRFYQNNDLTDRHGNRLNSADDSETENMFFSNDPDDDCIIAIANEDN